MCISKFLYLFISGHLLTYFYVLLKNIGMQISF